MFNIRARWCRPVFLRSLKKLSQEDYAFMASLGKAERLSLSHKKKGRRRRRRRGGGEEEEEEKGRKEKKKKRKCKVRNKLCLMVLE